MLKQTLIAATFSALTLSQAHAMTAAECTALWTNPDVAAAGKLTPGYADTYTKSGRVLAADGRVDEAAFLSACTAGVFNSVKPMVGAGKPMMDAGAPAKPMMDAGAPLAGANSFTAAQAKDRIEKAGFTAVTGLAKDKDGIWRGTASQGGKPVAIALDFKGNVVAK